MFKHLSLLIAFLTISAVAVADTASLPAKVLVDFTAENIKTYLISGVADRQHNRVLQADDPVRVASISKLALSLGVMRLVEQNKLDLDRDVSGYLGWTLRHPQFAETPITLRLLLSHQVGLTDNISYILALDDDLQQVLQNPLAWNLEKAPGKWFAYANMNFPVIAAVMEAASGQRFDHIMTNEVFKPLQLDACYNWSGCSDQAAAKAVVLYRANGDVAVDNLHGQRPVCPSLPASDGSCDLSRYKLGYNGSMFSPQGGLRISANDLARLGQVFLKNGAGFLKPESIAEMTSAHWVYNGSNGESRNGFFCAYGLAVQLLAQPGRLAECRDDPFADNQPRFGHSGSAYGLKSGLWLTPAAQNGVAFFVTSVADDAETGPESAFISELESLLTGWATASAKK